jgi:hypothetical protein
MAFSRVICGAWVGVGYGEQAEIEQMISINNEESRNFKGKILTIIFSYDRLFIK